jgi:hypothetical protein
MIKDYLTRMKMKMTKTKIWNNKIKSKNTMIATFGLLIKHCLVKMKTKIIKSKIETT